MTKKLSMKMIQPGEWLIGGYFVRQVAYREWQVTDAESGSWMTTRTRLKDAIEDIQGWAE